MASGGTGDRHLDRYDLRDNLVTLESPAQGSGEMNREDSDDGRQ